MSRRIILLLFSTIIIINKSKQQQQQHKDISDCQLNGLEQTITWSKSADFSRINHPKTINIWFGEKINLTYRDNHKRKLPKTWLWQTGHNFNEGYRLTESIECFVIENRTHLEPYTEINSLLIHKDGIYVLALIESDWHVHVQIGLQESYIPLAIFIVSVLKPVSISYTLRFITYHSDHECYDAEYKIWWIFQVLLNNKLLNIQNKPLLDSKFQYKTKEAKCLRLSNDDSPIQIIYYYNINRVKVTPNGYTPASEAQWKVIKSYKNYTIEENYTVDLSTEFGIVMRIRLKNIQVPFGNGMKITLKSISDEGLWKLGHMTPPFTDDKLLHQVYAVVRLNSTIYNLLREKPDQLNIQWILVEPLYGRLRTSNGITVQMNLYHHWTTAQYLTKLEINHLKLSDVRYLFVDFCSFYSKKKYFCIVEECINLYQVTLVHFLSQSIAVMSYVL
ncbi:unnamed protein product [Heterobilharzia americana]|nr:unnamed protein product [Heterobilharzia americana]